MRLIGTVTGLHVNRAITPGVDNTNYMLHFALEEHARQFAVALETEADFNDFKLGDHVQLVLEKVD